MENSSNFMFDLPKNKSNAIKVIGVGGGGSNAVTHMYKEGIVGVDFVICNTDAQALNNSPIPTKIQLGLSVTEGLGAGAHPEVGEKAALESIEDIKAMFGTHTKMAFITSGMGGGTGTGAAPIIAGIAKEMGILTVGIVTIPFPFEGKEKVEKAEIGIKKLRENVDSLIAINNDKLRELFGNLGYKSGFAKADEVLTKAAKGIAEVITKHYTQNIDLRDAKTVLENSGTAIMGSATASGENKAIEAITKALDSPLLNDNKITGAKNVLLLILSGDDEITIDEIGIINDYIQNEAGSNAQIIMGVGDDANLGDAISVTVIATGFPLEEQKYTSENILANPNAPTFHTLKSNFKSINGEELIKNIPQKKESVKRYLLDDDADSEINTQRKPIIIFDKTDASNVSKNTVNIFSEINDKSFSDESKTTIINLGDDEARQISIKPKHDYTTEAKSLNTLAIGENSIKIIADRPTKFSSSNVVSDAVKKRIEEQKKRLQEFNHKFISL